MNPPKNEGARNVERGKLKQKFVRSSDDNALVDKSKNELSVERLPAQLAKTKEETDQHHTPAQWFNEWVVDSEEKESIKNCQSEANDNNLSHPNEPEFFFY